MNSAKLALAGALAILVGSCTKTETATTTSTAANPPAQTVATAPPAPAPASTAPAQAVTTGALASADGEKAGTRIDITELKRTSGGTLNLKLVLVNNTDKELALHNNFLGDGAVSKNSYRDVSGIHLIDPSNKKKYFVVTDSERNCVCSKEVADVPPGGKTSLWAKFPAPPADVQKVTIEIPHFQPLDDVAIQ